MIVHTFRKPTSRIGLDPVARFARCQRRNNDPTGDGEGGELAKEGEARPIHLEPHLRRPRPIVGIPQEVLGDANRMMACRSELAIS
jgi:hypothetical protein